MFYKAFEEVFRNTSYNLLDKELMNCCSNNNNNNNSNNLTNELFYADYKTKIRLI